MDDAGLLLAGRALYDRRSSDGGDPRDQERRGSVIPVHAPLPSSDVGERVTGGPAKPLDAPTDVACARARRYVPTVEKPSAIRDGAGRNQSRLSILNPGSSATTRTPAPLPRGGTSCPVSPTTAASFVGLCPTTSARPPSASPSSTPRRAAPSTAESSSTSSGSAF